MNTSKIVNLCAVSCVVVGTSFTDFTSANIRIVAVSGNAAPDGNGIFTQFRAAPALNDAGLAAFSAELALTDAVGNDNTGLFVGDGRTSPAQIVREGQSAPDGNGQFGDFGLATLLPFVALNNSGDVLYRASFTGTGDEPNDSVGLFRGNSSIDPIRVVRSGQSLPNADGKYLSFGGLPGFNDAGQVGFLASLSDTGSPTDTEGMYLVDAMRQIVEVSRRGQMAPDGNGTLFSHSGGGLSATGEVVYTATIGNSSGGRDDNQAIYRADGVGVPQRIARLGETAPDGNGRLAVLGPPTAPNSVGQVAYNAFLVDTVGNGDDNEAIYRSDGLTPATIVRKGQPLPSGDGSFFDFIVRAENEAGEVLFQAIVIDDASGRGLYRGDGNDLIEVVRSDDPAPNGNGVFANFSGAALNELGQTAFLAFHADSTGAFGPDEGLYLYDETLGLIPAVRDGDQLLGSTITRLDFSGFEDERSGMNNAGEIAFSFILADGREGIAIWAVPEPHAMVWLLPVALLTLRRRQSNVSSTRQQANGRS